MAQGIVALRNPNEFVFQAPACFSLPSRDLVANVDYTTRVGRGLFFVLTSDYNDLTLVERHPELRADEESKYYLWIERSSVKEAHRYNSVRENRSYTCCGIGYDGSDWLSSIRSFCPGLVARCPSEQKSVSIPDGRDLIIPENITTCTRLSNIAALTWIMRPAEGQRTR